MRPSLITTLLSSEKRTDLLLLLNEKPRTIEEINQELDTNSVLILPQLKRLKESELVVQENRIYDLSLLGRIVVRKIEPLVKVFRLLEDNYDYWAGAKPGGIPADFFKRMEEFIVYRPGSYHGDNTSSVYPEMKEAFLNSKKIFLILSALNSRYPTLIKEHAKKGLEVSILLTPPIFERFTSEFKKELDTLITLENSEMYVLDNSVVPPNVVITDTMMLACFSSENSKNENNNVVGFGDKPVQWGLDLFGYFRTFAKSVIPENVNLTDLNPED